MLEYPNIHHWGQKESPKDPKESAKEKTNTPLTPDTVGVSPDARRRYPNIYYWGDDPAPVRTTKASENVAKTKLSGFPLGSMLGIALLKGAIDIPINSLNWIIEKAPKLEISNLAGGPPLSLDPIDRKLYLETYKKLTGKGKSK